MSLVYSTNNGFNRANLNLDSQSHITLCPFPNPPPGTHDKHKHPGHLLDDIGAHDDHHVDGGLDRGHLVLGRAAVLAGHLPACRQEAQRAVAIHPQTGHLGRVRARRTEPGARRGRLAGGPTADAALLRLDDLHLRVAHWQGDLRPRVDLTEGGGRRQQETGKGCYNRG